VYAGVKGRREVQNFRKKKIVETSTRRRPEMHGKNEGRKRKGISGLNTGERWAR